MEPTTLEESILSIIESKFGQLGKTYDAEVMLNYVQECEQAVLNYCLITEVPKPLRYAVANMSIDLFNFVSFEKTKDNVSIEGDVTSVRIGDTTTSFGIIEDGSNKNTANSHKADLDDILLNYRQQLNQFRRLW